MRVAPMCGVLSASKPLVGDADAAGEADLSVDYEEFPVSTVIQIIKSPPGRLMKTFHLDSSEAHSGQRFLIDFCASQPIEDDVN